MAHKSKSVLMSEIRMTYGDGDPWGTAMMWWFAIADVLYHTAPELIPADWEYWHSPVCDGVDPDHYPKAEIGIMLERGHITMAELLYAGTVITRYAEWLNMVPADFPVRPLKYADTLTAEDPVQCGECGRVWDDAIVTSYTPAPAARCPFEHFHRD